jgi:hypothetical protein
MAFPVALHKYIETAKSLFSRLFAFKKSIREEGEITFFLFRLPFPPLSPYLNGFVFIGRNLSFAVKRSLAFHPQESQFQD